MNCRRALPRKSKTTPNHHLGIEEPPPLWTPSDVEGRRREIGFRFARRKTKRAGSLILPRWMTRRAESSPEAWLGENRDSSSRSSREEEQFRGFETRKRGGGTERKKKKRRWQPLATRINGGREGRNCKLVPIFASEIIRAARHIEAHTIMEEISISREIASKWITDACETRCAILIDLVRSAGLFRERCPLPLSGLCGMDACGVNNSRARTVNFSIVSLVVKLFRIFQSQANVWKCMVVRRFVVWNTFYLNLIVLIGKGATYSL